MAEISYQGFPAASLLASLFPTAKTFAFTCSDGYRIVVPAEDLRKDEAYLVFARNDQKAFTLRNFLADPAQGKIQVLAPLYLVWHASSASSTARWAFQITKISQIKTQVLAEIPHPPNNAASQLLRGYEVFRSKCMSCHQAAASASAPSLHQVADKVQKMGNPWLARWLQDPQKEKPAATMPAVKLGLSDLSDLGVYIKFVKN
jgi:cytochrome c5